MKLQWRVVVDCNLIPPIQLPPSSSYYYYYYSYYYYYKVLQQLQQQLLALALGAVEAPHQGGDLNSKGGGGGKGGRSLRGQRGRRGGAQRCVVCNL